MFDVLNRPVISLKSQSGFWIRTCLCVHVSQRLLVVVVVHAYFFNRIVVLSFLVLENPSTKHFNLDISLSILKF